MFPLRASRRRLRSQAKLKTVKILLNILRGHFLEYCT